MMFYNLAFIFWIMVFLPLSGSFTNHKMALNNEEIAYFAETAFYKNVWLSRWEKPILVELDGNFNATDIEKINFLITDIKSEIGNRNILYVNNGGNLIIHFDTDLLHFDENPIFKNDKVPFGYMKPTLNSKHEFLRADVYIHPTLIANKRYQVLRHEFCHALGLMSHAYKIYHTENLLGKTIFGDERDYEKSFEEQNIPTLDKVAIRFLYQKSLSLNYSKKDFDREYLSYITPK